MTELLLPRLKQEIEARLAELRPLIAEIEQLEAAKAALLARSDVPAALGAPRAKPSRRAARGGARARRAARAKVDGERAPRGANREAILALVEERPGVSVAEISSVTKIAKATVATTVSKLKREGVLADEAGGVKLASRQRQTLGGAPGGAEQADAEPAGAEPGGAKSGAAKSGGAKSGGAKPGGAKPGAAEPAAAAATRDEGVSDAEWDEAAPPAAADDASA